MATALEQIRTALLNNNTGITQENFPAIPVFRRARSTSRKAAPPPRAASVKLQLPLKLSKLELMRNLSLMGTPQTIKTVMATLKGDTSIVDNGIVSVKQKGKSNFTVTFKNEKGVRKTDELFANNYRDTILVNKVNLIIPIVKVTRIFSNSDQNIDIIRQIKKQNPWLSLSNFDVERTYEVETDMGR